MIIKNVSPRVIRLEDFPDEKPMMPGDELDMTRYTPQERSESQQLQDLFQRGALLNLGFAPTSKKLRNAKVTSSPLNKYAVNDPTLGATLIPSGMEVEEEDEGVRRRAPNLRPHTTPTRYNNDALDQYQFELEEARVVGSDIPQFVDDEDDFEQEEQGSFVQLQDEGRVVTISIDEETGATYVNDLTPGQIPSDFAVEDPAVFVDRQKYSIEEIEDAEARKARVHANLHKKIESEVKKKCLYPCANGKPCQRPVMKGYDRCYLHLPADVKKKIKLEQKQKELERKQLEENED